jgi:hypothetical protein
MVVGMAYWMEASASVPAAGQASQGLDRAGLIVIIVVAIIAVIAFVWIFHETGRRD